MQASNWLGHPSIKPGLWGVVVGAIAMTVVGFWGMGWSTSGTAALMVQQQSAAAVVTALVPYCVAKAERDPDAAKLTKFRAEAESYAQSNRSGRGLGHHARIDLPELRARERVFDTARQREGGLTPPVLAVAPRAR